MAPLSEIVISTNGFITKSSKSLRMFNTGDIDKVAMGESWLKLNKGCCL
jgi:hypothetical protein